MKPQTRAVHLVSLHQLIELDNLTLEAENICREQYNTDLPRLRERSQARFSGNTHCRISLRHRAQGGPIGNPSGPVPRSHLALRCRQGMHAL